MIWIPPDSVPLGMLALDRRVTYRGAWPWLPWVNSVNSVNSGRGSHEVIDQSSNNDLLMLHLDRTGRPT